MPVRPSYTEIEHTADVGVDLVAVALFGVAMIALLCPSCGSKRAQYYMLNSSPGLAPLAESAAVQLKAQKQVWGGLMPNCLQLFHRASRKTCLR